MTLRERQLKVRYRPATFICRRGLGESDLEEDIL